MTDADSREKIPHIPILIVGAIWMFFGLFGSQLVEEFVGWTGIKAFAAGLVVWPAVIIAIAAVAYILGFVVWMVYERVGYRVEVKP